MLAEKLPHLHLLNAYGATETTSPSTIMPRTRWRDHYDSVRITVRCGQIKVVDDDGVEAPGGLADLAILASRVEPTQSCYGRSVDRIAPPKCRQHDHRQAGFEQIYYSITNCLCFHHMGVAR